MINRTEPHHGKAARVAIEVLAALFGALALAPAMAETANVDSPTGLWQTIDDQTGKPRALVRIVEQGGTLRGTIEKRLDPDAKPTDVCEKCTDDRKDQPIRGLLIIKGARKAAGNDAEWDEGLLLDPESGKEYRLRLTVRKQGQQLEIRAFIGTPFIGRTQLWQRAE